MLSDDELDELVEDYVAAAVLAHQAGFDFVDVKHCHGYLLHELLTGYGREGRYGGDLDGRTEFLRTVVAGIRERAPGLAVAVRLSAFDMVPFAAGDGGVGEPETHGPYRYAFGGDGTGLGIDLAETHALLDRFDAARHRAGQHHRGQPVLQPPRPAAGVLPAVRRLPAARGSAGGRRPPARRHRRAHRRAPDLTIIGSGYSYLQDWLAHVGQAVVAGGGATMVGLGRMILSYPDLAADVLAGRPIERGLICRTFSDCTTAPAQRARVGLLPARPVLQGASAAGGADRAKRAAKERLR